MTVLGPERLATSWEVDDTPLQTVCSQVVSLDSKYGLPSLRGDDSLVAYRRGKRWRPKTPDSRIVPLGMWVTGTDPATGVAPAIGRERQFHANMTALQRLLWTDGTRQVELKKKWRDPATGTVLFANAMAELVDGMAVEMDESNSIARCVAEFRLADPYFYGALTTVALPLGTTNVVVPGDAPTSRIGLTVTGALGSPTLTNAAPTPDHWVKLGSSVAAGDSVFLDVDNYVAVRASDDANLIGAVTRSGGRPWFRLWPGANALTLTATSGAGSMTLEYAAAYL